MKVLVTGATGFVGGWLVERLKSENVEVLVLRRKSSSRHEFGTGVNVVEGDVTDASSLVAAFKSVDTVFHLAGVVGYSRAARVLMEKVNVQGTANVIQAARANSVRRLVHMSSVVAVGASFDGAKPLNESSPFNLHHLDLGYFETKLKAEQLVMDSTRRGELDSVCVNPSTIYGAGDAAKGSRGIQLKVARGKFPFYNTGGVSVIAVEDIVEAVIAAWRRGRTGERYILSGDNITIRKLFELIAHFAGEKPPSIHLPNKALTAIGWVGDRLEAIGKKGPLNSENAWTARLFHWFDHQKATRELGLKPRPAEVAIENSVRWIKEKGLIR